MMPYILLGVYMTVEELRDILSDADPEAIVSVKYYDGDSECCESLYSSQIDFMGDSEVIIDMTC